MSSPDSNQFSTTVNCGSRQSPADTAQVAESKDADDDLYKERIDRYIADKVPSTPLSPADEGSSGDNVTVNSTQERVKAELNAFKAAFEASEEEKKKVEEEEKKEKSEEEEEKKKKK